MKTHTPECSIVVPVYNSEKCLPELVRQIDAALSKDSISYEIILVNDCSHDNSWQTIVSLSKADPRIIGISFRKNFGQDNAIMAGLRNSLGKSVVIMDDDLQHNPACIPDLRSEMTKGFDVVYANYTHNKKQALWKNIGSWFNDKIADVVLGKPPSIYLSPFKIISRVTTDEVCNYYGPYAYVDGLILRTTSHISQIFIEHQKRFKGRSTYTFIRSILVWLNLTTNFSILPLRLATFLGLTCSLSGLLLSSFFIFNRYIDPIIPSINLQIPLSLLYMPPGWLSIFVSVQILGGAQLFCIGILGEYLGRTYLSINRHPQYVIQERTGTP